MCPVGRTKRDEPSDWYSDGASVQAETFATLRLAAWTRSGVHTRSLVGHFGYWFDLMAACYPNSASTEIVDRFY